MRKASKENCMRICKRATSALSQTLSGVPFCFGELALSLLVVALNMEVAGAVAFVALLCLKLLFCDDVFATTLPFLLLCAFVTNCYDSFDTFIGYAVFAPVVAACAVYHFWFHAKPFRKGESAWGIFFVTVAVMLGGVGRFGLLDYVFGAYYIFGLGAGMLVAYYIMKSQFSVRRDYDMKTRFALVMTLWGVLCAGMVAMGHFKAHFDLPRGGYTIGFSRNNISTMLMFAMPFPLFLGLKRKWASILSAVFFATLCTTTSRGGVLFGTVEFLVCGVYWVFANGKTAKQKWILASVCTGVTVIIVAIFFERIREVVWDRLIGNDGFSEEPRTKMVWQAWEKFKESPIFGTGILDNETAYGEMKKKGAMGWYHMMIPQVIASMGIVGVLAYGAQILQRARLIFKSVNKWSLCLGISYLGILMMSQVNPGEFCPLPFELVAVLLFIFQELRLEEQSLPITRETWEKRLKNE